MKLKKANALFLALLLVAAVFVGCGSKPEPTEKYKVDEEILKTIAGNYMPYQNVDSWWVLDINEPAYFSIYDAEAGNPGVEGKIIHLDEEKIVFRINQSYYEELPANWELEEYKGKDILILSYKVTDSVIELTNNGDTIAFKKWER